MKKNDSANRSVGIWIDHGHATIVSLSGKQLTTETWDSEVERHPRLAGGSRSATVYRAQDVASERTYEQRFQRQLTAYYKRLIGRLRDADQLFIFGPGKAKAELKKALEKYKDFRGTIVGVEPADKMTEPQIAAKVRQRFSATR
jgi:hypothetical protein